MTSVLNSLGLIQRFQRDIANGIAKKHSTLGRISGNISTTTANLRETERQLQSLTIKTDENDTWHDEATIKVLRN